MLITGSGTPYFTSQMNALRTTHSGNNSNQASTKQRIPFDLGAVEQMVTQMMKTPMQKIAIDEKLQARIEQADHFMAQIHSQNSPEGVQKQIDDLMASAKGNEQTRDIAFVFSVDGQVVAYMGHDTGITSRNAVGRLTPGGDVEAQLRETYGDRLTVERYSPGSGPTRAEMFERFNPGLSYREHIADSVRQIRQEAANRQYSQQQQLAEDNRRNAVEQSSVFKINGTIVGSLDAEGKATVRPANIIHEALKSGHNKDAVVDFLKATMTSGANPVDAETVSAILQPEFGDAFEVLHFETGTGPSLGSILETQNNQWRKNSGLVNETA